MKMNLSQYPLINSKYAITDTFGNIYSSNTNPIYTIDSGKFDEKLLQSKTHWYVENPLLIEKRKLNRFSQSHLFNLSFPFRVYWDLLQILTLCIFCYTSGRRDELLIKLRHCPALLKVWSINCRKFLRKKDKKLILQTETNLNWLLKITICSKSWITPSKDVDHWEGKVDLWKKDAGSSEFNHFPLQYLGNY